MPVPQEDIVCRFIRYDKWSKRENRPRPGAFKQPDLSVWHPERLRNKGVRLEDLQFDSLEGSGQALITVAEIFEAAQTAEQKKDGKLHVEVEWRPETVDEARQQWSYAHAQVETQTEGEPPSEEGGLMSAFRMELCKTAQCVSHPKPPSEKTD